MSDLADRPERWPVLETRDLHRDGWVVALRADTVTRPDSGGEAPFRRIVLEHPVAVVVLAVDDDDRVVLLRQLSRAPLQMSVIGDSRGGRSSADVLDDPLVTGTSRDLAVRRSTVSRSGERFAEVTIPVGRDGTVLLLSASLDRALGDVNLVKRRLLISGGAVLALVVLQVVLGFMGHSLSALAFLHGVNALLLFGTALVAGRRVGGLATQAPPAARQAVPAS